MLQPSVRDKKLSPPEGGVTDGHELPTWALCKSSKGCYRQHLLPPSLLFLFSFHGVLTVLPRLSQTPSWSWPPSSMSSSEGPHARLEDKFYKCSKPTHILFFKHHRAVFSSFHSVSKCFDTFFLLKYNARNRVWVEIHVNCLSFASSPIVSWGKWVSLALFYCLLRLPIPHASRDRLARLSRGHRAFPTPVGFHMVTFCENVYFGIDGLCQEHPGSGSGNGWLTL